ncbi:MULTISPECIES: adenine phosphoribosyltransferase [Eubacterium]|uniref:Adenine phosphoribosyltransferase n=2 Tax=Eubacterium TaxID=1730 RepID=A0A1H4A5I2_9FIRM|nr:MULTISPECIES: adenine phosphoribosyltransferase [Eubacterium]MDD4690935.1 adenine phosphoribosyltransferase [Eubacterium aggregans]MEA5074302.1 adenine phosphoribosyltransferase [Eubacterium aggregans]SDX62597.1 adenine phosphoribosyltransferase [Eubacterium barkeri]SEA31167.1 adenine phosphoribosyltransferase [Eubacterium aggregans]
MDFKSKISVYEGFPKEGISFKDINSLIKDPDAFRAVIDDLYKIAKALDVNIVVIPEARGYIFGSALAYRLGAGLVPVRKPGKLPGKVVSQKYSLEYGSNTIEIQHNAIKPGDRVLIIDDLLATGGTMKAAIDLVENLGGEVCGALFVIELTELGGRDLLKDYFVSSIVSYPY